MKAAMPPIVLLLSDGRQVALRGRIDRIDRYDAPDGVYLRVIDYKSARQSLEAARAWWGLQLQLLLYLDVCTSAIPGGKPAGAFYFYVADPLVESASDAAEIVEGKLREVFQLRGRRIERRGDPLRHGRRGCPLGAAAHVPQKRRAEKNSPRAGHASAYRPAFPCARGGRGSGGPALRRGDSHLPRS